jgi:hypothetical protein
LFGHLIGAGVHEVAWGYAAAAALMVFAGVVEALMGVDAEGKSLEDVAEPLSA